MTSVSILINYVHAIFIMIHSKNLIHVTYFGSQHDDYNYRYTVNIQLSPSTFLFQPPADRLVKASLHKPHDLVLWSCPSDVRSQL